MWTDFDLTLLGVWLASCSAISYFAYSALARGLFDVDKLGAFFDVILQDPVIGRTKLIAEPVRKICLL